MRTKGAPAEEDNSCLVHPLNLRQSVDAFCLPSFGQSDPSHQLVNRIYPSAKSRKNTRHCHNPVSPKEPHFPPALLIHLTHACISDSMVTESHTRCAGNCADPGRPWPAQGNHEPTITTRCLPALRSPRIPRRLPRLSAQARPQVLAPIHLLTGRCRLIRLVRQCRCRSDRSHA